MAENAVDQIVAHLRERATEYFPSHQEVRNVRVVGHTPKNDHYIYDIVVDFPAGNERVLAKLYRAGKHGPHHARELAESEFKNLRYAFQACGTKELSGIPKPLGDFTHFGAVVAEKVTGLPLQSVIIKAALLPGFADHGLLRVAATNASRWLKRFHEATADGSAPLDGPALLKDMERLCESCKDEGLDDASIRIILSGARNVMVRARKALPVSAVLNDFAPLNILVSEHGVGIADYAKLSMRGYSVRDIAYFLACIEALEKYPFCNRDLISEMQETFLDAYAPSDVEDQVVRVMKMQALLQMFAQGRNVKESALRKKVMWATVMKRFIHQAARRSMSSAA